MRPNLVALLVISAFGASSDFAQVIVRSLPPEFLATAISDDGQVAVGSTNDFPGRWTADRGLTVYDQTPHFSRGFDVTADGNTTTGYAGRILASRSVYWRGDDTLPLALFGGEAGDYISADGSAIVGRDTVDRPQVRRWERLGESYESVPMGIDTSGGVGGISGDGAVVVGWTFTSPTNSGSTTQAFRWTAATGATSLSLAEAGSGSMARAISRDGRVIFGSLNESFFRWSSETGAEIFGPVPSISRQRLSADSAGKLVVGFDNVVWSEEQGFVSAYDWLRGEGASLDGWKIMLLTDVNGDGSVVSGYGTDPFGISRSFIVSGLGAVPEPANFAAIAMLLLAFLILRKHLKMPRRQFR